MEQDKSPKEMEKHKKDVQRIVRKYEKHLDKALRITRLSKAFLLPIIFAFVSLMAINQIFGIIPNHELSKQITEVENAIRNLRNLETYLEKTKSDMIATEEAKVRIEEEYNKVKELETLTETNSMQLVLL